MAKLSAAQDPALASWRQALGEWEPRWRALSRPAKLIVLDSLKFYKTDNPRQPGISSAGLSPEAIQELVKAEFVELRPGKKSKDPQEVVIRPEAIEFASKVRNWRQHHLLGADERAIERLANYVFHHYGGPRFSELLRDVLRGAGFPEIPPQREGIQSCITSHNWPQWVVGRLKDKKAAEAVFAALKQADGPVPLAELPDRLPAKDRGDALAGLIPLLDGLAAFVDLDPKWLQVAVGLLPDVRRKFAYFEGPRPPLVAAEPKTLGPDGAIWLDDLRAFLLELAGEPARLKQGGDLFQKQVERFLAALPVVPDWIAATFQLTPDDRLDDAQDLAEGLGLAEETLQDDVPYLRLAAKADAWLAGSLAEQYAKVYEWFRGGKATGRGPLERLLSIDGGRYRDDFYDLDFGGYGQGSADAQFLGFDLNILQRAPGRQTYDYYYRAKSVPSDDVRRAFLRAYQVLPLGEFRRLDSFLMHATFGDLNPLHAYTDPTRYIIRHEGRPLASIPEAIQGLGMACLTQLLQGRLIPLGCVQLGVDDQGGVLVARLPRLEAYFGLPVPAEALAGPATAGGARVVVQPDFSVIVIGVDSRPIAELAPFCDRSGRAEGGAALLKITRDSIVRAVMHGLTEEEILGRLKRLSDPEPPANVVAEIRHWARWARPVTLSELTVLRCPDRESADRAAAALGKRAERLTDTIVALDGPSLGSAERAKLRSQGILIMSEAPGGRKAAPKKKTKKGRSY